MKLAHVAAFLAATPMVVAKQQVEHPHINQGVVDAIRASKTTYEVWDPEQNPLRHLDKDELKSLFGALPGSKQRMMPRVKTKVPRDFPTEFEARTAYPQCAHKVRNQFHCGSCWAFSAAETWAVNACVHPEGSTRNATGEVFSVEHILACDDFMQEGCHGGHMGYVWDFVVKVGLVKEECFPYTSFNMTVDSCPAEIGPDTRTCPGRGDWDVFQCKTPYQYLMGNNFTSSEALQMRGVMDLGAVSSDFDIYADFLNYKSGVYQHVGDDEPLGGHGIKIVGFGTLNATDTEPAVPYWIVQNSWGSDWGEDGFFRIARSIVPGAYIGARGAWACGKELV